jgi:hypothetical protein
MYADNTTAYLSIRQDLIRYAGNELNHSEYRVFQFILERTLRFGKEEETIPYRHLLEGFFCKDPGACLAPLPVSKRSAVSAIESLERKGLISVCLKGANPTNAIRVIVSKVEEFLKMCALKLSKAYQRLLGSDEESDRVVQNSTKGQESFCTGGSAEKHQHNKRVDRTGRNKPEDFVVPGRDDHSFLSSARDVVQHVTSSYRERRKERRAAVDTVFCAKTFRLTYNDALAAFRAEHPAVPVTPVSDKEAAIFVRSASPLPLFQNGDWKAFVHDCIENWDEYKDHLHARWRTHAPPAVPVFQFFLTMQARHFAPYYAAKLSGEVDRMRAKRTTRTAAVELRLEEKDREVEALTEQLRNAEYRLRLSRKPTGSVKPQQTQQVRVTPEQAQRRFQDALADLPSWEDMVHA